MKRKSVNSQLYNYKTYLNYKDKEISLAMNVFQFKNINPFIDMAQVNKTLLMNGSIAFFLDDVTGELLAMPYSIMGSLDYYGRPQRIKPIPYFGYYNRILNRNEFVIMYDNASKISIYNQLVQSAERLALIKRGIDINISQQMTNRFWKTSEENQRTLKGILEQVDSNVETIVTYDNFDLDETQQILNPAPFVADKLNDCLKAEWSEFLEIIGISETQINKKERIIKDEIMFSMGGTIASRFNRYDSRRKAVDEINKKFGLNIEVGFYDGLPSTLLNPEEFLNPNEQNNIEENEVDTNETNI